MPFPFRLIFILCALIGVAAPARAANNNAPVPTAAIPARLDVVTFLVHVDGEDHKLLVTPTPDLLRVDLPRDGLTVIYEPRTQHYTGLENRNYTYWEFSWPEVKSAVASTKRYETRLREVGVDGLNGGSADPSIPTLTPSLPGLLDTNLSTTPAAPLSDNSGYIWQPTTKHKRIAGLDCVLWNGTSISGDPVQAWCYGSLQPKVQVALAQLRTINEPMALVPVRDVVPPFVFEVTGALTKGGVTPLLITWGGDQDKNRFELIDLGIRDGKLSFFSVPKLYVKTTLVTMDGLGSQKPPEAKPSDLPRHTPAPPR